VTVGILGDLLTRLDIVIPCHNAVNIHTSRFQDGGVVVHDKRTKMVVDAIVVTTGGVGGQTGLDNIIPVGINGIVQRNQLNVTFREGSKLANLDVDQIRRTHAHKQR